MNRDIRVLVTSISRKVPLLKAVKNAFHFFGNNSLIFGADRDNCCIGQYFVDEFWHMPKLEDLNQSAVLEYCKNHAINVIIPTRDAELQFWSENEHFFLEHEIHLMVSSKHSIKNCLDKQYFFELLDQHHIKTPKTSSDIADIASETFVVKTRVGAGSIGIGLNLTKELAISHAKNLKNPIFQPFIKGDEYTVDLYIDKRSNIHGICPRKRILVVNGESQITETVQNKQLEDLCRDAAKLLELRGHVLFQVIQEKESKSYQIIECNARFGGASTLSVAAGLDSFSWFFHEALNETLPEFKRIPETIRLIRHAEDTFISL